MSGGGEMRALIRHFSQEGYEEVSVKDMQPGQEMWLRISFTLRCPCVFPSVRGNKRFFNIEKDT